MPAAMSVRSNAQSTGSPIPLSGAAILVMPETLLLGPPGLQPARRLLLAQRALVEPQFHEEVQRLADSPPRSDAEELHDLVAVQVRAQGLQFLLLAELGDAGLQLVHAPGQRPRLGCIPCRAVAAGQLVEQVEMLPA